MDRSQMSFFPENVQKDIYARIEQAFHPECPYGPKIIEMVKNKFHEWERFKLQTVSGLLKDAFTERKRGKELQLDR